MGRHARAGGLFREGVFDVRSVMGLDYADTPASADSAGAAGATPHAAEAIRNPEVRAIVQDLHRQMNSGQDTQEEIDRYMLFLSMEASDAPALRALPWQCFVLQARDVVRLDHLVDIGSAVRDMLMLSPYKNSIHRVLQYSMPYIKHNRLNFPAFEDMTSDDLAHMVRIVMACCLGCLRANTKRPVFALRVQLYRFFYNLLASGTSKDHFVFCAANLCLLRLAMIEYFIIFIDEFMPVEKAVMCSTFQLSNTIDELSHSFCLIIDTFRQTCMQVTELDFANINARAHIAIEKCNRVTKGKNRQLRATDSGAKLASDDAVLRAAMAAPVFAHPAYAVDLPVFRGCSWQHIVQVQAVHAIIAVQPLPANLTALQADCVLRMLRHNSSSIVQCTQLYVCLRCVARSAKFAINKKMRVMSDGSCHCSQCHSSAFVLPISMMGRIVRIQGVYLHLCHFCCCIHEWKCSGHEFTSCERSKTCVPATALLQPPSYSAKACAVCARTSSISSWTVLDDRLGVLVDLCLCAKHKPLAHQHESVYNIQTLRLAILHKLNRYRLSALEIQSL